MRKRCHKKANKYILLVAFGLGLLLASFCSPQFLVVVLSLTVIILGIICYRH
ncbi:MAG: hypothetical protein U0K54_00915 [Acutalibacteraceae bacterium]|nr:hypothetical protein [Acutalibacteraceae bacterium]